MKRQLATLLLLFMSAAVITTTITSCKGGVKDEDVKTAVETALKANPDLQGITVSVKDGIASLSGEVKDDAIKDNSGVKADVKDGVVTLTGEIKKTDLPKLMQKISALKPKKIENKLTVK